MRALFEMPRDVAAKYTMTMDRVAELGHLPVTPYGTSVPSQSAPSQDDVRDGVAASSRAVS